MQSPRRGPRRPDDGRSGPDRFPRDMPPQRAGSKRRYGSRSPNRRPSPPHQRLRRGSWDGGFRGGRGGFRGRRGGRGDFRGSYRPEYRNDYGGHYRDEYREPPPYRPDYRGPPPQAYHGMPNERDYYAANAGRPPYPPMERPREPMMYPREYPVARAPPAADPSGGIPVEPTDPKVQAAGEKLTPKAGFRFVASQLSAAIPVEEDAEYYRKYCDGYKRHCVATFLPEVRHQEWFREKYDPLHMVRQRAQVLDAGHRAAKEFIRLLDDEKSAQAAQEKAAEDKESAPTRPKPGSMAPGITLCDLLPIRRLKLGIDGKPVPSRYVYIKNLHPSVRRSDLLDLLEKLEGFTCLEMSDATRSGGRSSFHRNAWALFDTPGHAVMAVKSLTSVTVPESRLLEGITWLGNAYKAAQRQSEENPDKQAENAEREEAEAGGETGTKDSETAGAEDDKSQAEEKPPVLQLKWMTKPPRLDAVQRQTLQVQLEDVERQRRVKIPPCANRKEEVVKDLDLAKKLAKALDLEAKSIAKALDGDVAGSTEKWDFDEQEEAKESAEDPYGYGGYQVKKEWNPFNGEDQVTIDDMTSHEVYQSLSEVEQLDLVIAYLRQVHSYEYFAGYQGSEAGDTRHSCGDTYVRTGAPDGGEKETSAEERQWYDRVRAVVALRYDLAKRNLEAVEAEEELAPLEESAKPTTAPEDTKAEKDEPQEKGDSDDEGEDEEGEGHEEGEDAEGEEGEVEKQRPGRSRRAIPKIRGYQAVLPWKEISSNGKALLEQAMTIMNTLDLDEVSVPGKGCINTCLHCHLQVLYDWIELHRDVLRKERSDGVVHGCILCSNEGVKKLFKAKKFLIKHLHNKHRDESRVEVHRVSKLTQPLLYEINWSHSMIAQRLPCVFEAINLLVAEPVTINSYISDRRGPVYTFPRHVRSDPDTVRTLLRASGVGEEAIASPGTRRPRTWDTRKKPRNDAASSRGHNRGGAGHRSFRGGMAPMAMGPRPTMGYQAPMPGMGYPGMMQPMMQARMAAGQRMPRGPVRSGPGVRGGMEDQAMVAAMTAAAMVMGGGGRGRGRGRGRGGFGFRDKDAPRGHVPRAPAPGGSAGGLVDYGDI